MSLGMMLAAAARAESGRPERPDVPDWENSPNSSYVPALPEEHRHFVGFDNAYLRYRWVQVFREDRPYFDWIDELGYRVAYHIVYGERDWLGLVQ
jgi:hypothetical protein